MFLKGEKEEKKESAHSKKKKRSVAKREKKTSRETKLCLVCVFWCLMFINCLCE